MFTNTKNVAPQVKTALEWNPALRHLLLRLDRFGARFVFEEVPDHPTQLEVKILLNKLTCFITPEIWDYGGYGGYLYADRTTHHNKMRDADVAWCIYNTNYEDLLTRLEFLRSKKFNDEVLREQNCYNDDFDRKELLKARFNSLIKSGKLK